MLQRGDNMELNVEILNGDCIVVMDELIKEGKKFTHIITSPPYNSARRANSEYNLKHHSARYDIQVESKTSQEYADWVVEIFKRFEYLLEPNGCIIWNVSYSSASSISEIECINSLWFSIYGVLKNTNFTIADKIVWRKSSALPNNVSPNKLTRICEDVFVFCRKSEYKTFHTNKKVKSISSKGQRYYENIFNYLEAPNNDGANPLNKATFSTEFVEKLMEIYCRDGSSVLDPFCGTGTTLNACLRKGFSGVGIELSKNQCEYARDRLEIKF